MKVSASYFPSRFPSIPSRTFTGCMLLIELEFQRLQIYVSMSLNLSFPYNSSNTNRWWTRVWPHRNIELAVAGPGCLKSEWLTSSGCLWLAAWLPGWPARGRIALSDFGCLRLVPPGVGYLACPCCGHGEPRTVSEKQIPHDILRFLRGLGLHFSLRGLFTDPVSFQQFPLSSRFASRNLHGSSRTPCLCVFTILMFPPSRFP